MAIVNTYRTFNENCREAFGFYEIVLGKKISQFGLFGEMPQQPGMVLGESEKSRVMHVTMPVSSETALMGSDTFPNQPVSIGNNFPVSLNPDSKAEADRVFAELSKEGKVVVPLSDTFWSACFGMVQDKFGVNWMINFSLPHQ